MTKSRRATGEFDQGEIEAFEIGYWGFERKCIPDNKNNRECVLVAKAFFERVSSELHMDRVGSIPARAGEPTKAASHRSANRVSPRVSGGAV